MKKLKAKSMPSTASVLANIESMFKLVAEGKSVAKNSVNSDRKRDYSDLPEDITVYARTC